MHHKRRRPRNRRAGCKLCKPWKVNGVRTERADGEKFSDHRRRMIATQHPFTEDIAEGAANHMCALSQGQ